MDFDKPKVYGDTFISDGLVLDEKPRFTFANFLQLFIQGASLTHSAMLVSFAYIWWVRSQKPHETSGNKISRPIDEKFSLLYVYIFMYEWILLRFKYVYMNIEYSMQA